MLHTPVSFPGSTRGRIIVVTLAVAIVAVALAVAMPPSHHAAVSEVATRGGAPASTQSSTVGATESAIAPDALEASKPATTAKLGGISPGSSAGSGTEPMSGTDSVGSGGDASASTDTAVTLDAKIARTAAMQLQVKRGQFTSGWLALSNVAGQVGGIVTTSSTTDTGSDARSGTMTLRVPSEHFQLALDKLAKVGKVQSQSTGSQDVTQDYVDSASRLRHDKAVEQRLLSLLARTTTVSETLAVQNQLDSVQSEIEVETGRIQYLSHITSFSTIDVTLTEKARHAAPVHTSHHSTIGTAFRAAAERFTANVGTAIVWLGGALPALLALVGLVVGVRYVIARRNRTTG